MINFFQDGGPGDDEKLPVYYGPRRLKACQGQGCSEQATNLVSNLFGVNRENLAPQDAWYKRAAILKSGGNEVYNASANQPMDYNALQLGDFVSLKRPGHSKDQLRSKLNGYSLADNEKNQHVGVVVGRDQSGKPLIRHGSEGILGNAYAVVDPVDSVYLPDEDLHYKVMSIYRSPFTADASILKNRKNRSFYNQMDYDPNDQVTFNNETLLTSKKKSFIDAGNRQMKKLQQITQLDQQSVKALLNLAYGVFGNESRFGEGHYMAKETLASIRENFHGEPASLGPTRLKYKTLTENADGTTSEVGKMFNEADISRDDIKGHARERDINWDAVVQGTVLKLASELERIKRNPSYNFNPSDNTVYGNVPLLYALASSYKNPSLGQVKNYLETNDRQYSQSAYRNMQELEPQPLPVNLTPFEVVAPKKTNIVSSKQTGKSGRKSGAQGLHINNDYNDSSIVPLSINSFSQPVFQFNGPRHENGGIPISYQGKQVEVEGDETGYIDTNGDLNVFGNLTVPGTRLKFKTAAKRLADKEKAAKNEQARAERLIKGVTDQQDPRQKLRLNSGQVQLQAALSKQKTLSTAKEDLSDLQQSILQSYQHDNFAPVAAYGTWLPSGPGIDPWELPSTPQIVMDQAKMLNDSLGYKNVRINSVPGVVTSPIPPGVSSAGTDSIIPQDDFEFGNMSTPVYKKPLGLTQILPELYSLATNHVESVPSYNFQPQLASAYRVNFDDKLQENNNTFRSLVKQVENNPAALSQLAAGKYQADTSVLGERFRTNLGLQSQRDEQNIQAINQAKLQNLAMAERNDIARAQNAAASRSITREALKSITAKSIQQKQANEELTLLNQLIPYYQFNQDSGQWDPSGKRAPIMINGMPVGNQEITPLYGEKERTRYNRDSKGRLIERVKSKIPSVWDPFKR